jgi:ankyrin repeat protein
MVGREDVDSNRVNLAGCTALHWAAAGHCPPAVKALILGKDLNVNAVDNGGETALARVALLGNHESMELLLSREDIDADVPNLLGLTPFLLTAGTHYLGGFDAMKLLNHRSDVNVHARDSRGRNALWLAARCAQYPEVIEYLLHFRDADGQAIDSDSADDDGITPLEIAATNTPDPDRPEVLDEVLRLLNDGEPITVSSIRAVTPTAHPDACHESCYCCTWVHPTACRL